MSMFTVHDLLPSKDDFYTALQQKVDEAEDCRHERYLAAMLLIRITRGYLIRKHVAWLSHNARIIQCAFRRFIAMKAYRKALRIAVRNKHAKYYARAATIVQSLWRGHYSRKTKFCYRTYRRWLYTVKERGERRAAEALEFGIRSRADDLRILEEESRQWLAFVVFKLHHLLRTYVCTGVYSDTTTTELSEFEKLLRSIRYTEYMKRLKRKYDEFIRKHRPGFSNKRLFPIIGDGADYWYLSLPEMYELTITLPKKENYRHKATHHGEIHEEPFLWRRIKPPAKAGRGPFIPPRSTSRFTAPPPAPSPTPLSCEKQLKSHKDPRFHLYVKHYKPDPDLFDYVDFHINVLLTRKYCTENYDRE